MQQANANLYTFLFTLVGWSALIKLLQTYVHTPSFPSIMERITFEEALKKLESIVGKLEEGSVTLEESVNLYEEGLKLSKYCSEILDSAELRIEKVNQQTA
jgi:exodeoxyribonuclease VII small subunit